MLGLFKRRKYAYFHIDELNRDSVVASALKKELYTRGITLVYGCRKYFRVIKYFIGVFDAAVFPKPHFLRYADKKYYKNSNIVMLYTENIGIIADSGEDKMTLKGSLDAEFMSGDTDYVDSVSAFCFWGNKVHDTVIKHYPYLKGKCHIVGHPRHAIETLPEKNKKGALSHEKTIGIVTRHTYLNDYMSRSVLEKIAQYLDGDVKYEYRNDKTGDYLVTQRRGSVPENDAFIEAIDAKNIFLIVQEALRNGYKVLIKTHPREKADVWAELFESRGLRVEIADPLVPFTHWLNGIDFLIGPPSSSFYDSLMRGVFPISIHNLDQRRAGFILPMSEDNNKLMPHISAPLTIDDIFSLIDSSPSVERSDAVNDILLSEADFPNCNRSINKIGEVIEEIVDEKGNESYFLKIILLVIYQFMIRVVNMMFFVRYFASCVNSSSFVITRSISRFIDGLSALKKMK